MKKIKKLRYHRQPGSKDPKRTAEQSVGHPPRLVRSGNESVKIQLPEVIPLSLVSYSSSESECIAPEIRSQVSREFESWFLAFVRWIDSNPEKKHDRRRSTDFVTIKVDEQEELFSNLLKHLAMVTKKNSFQDDNFYRKSQQSSKSRKLRSGKSVYGVEVYAKSRYVDVSSLCKAMYHTKMLKELLLLFVNISHRTHLHRLSRPRGVRLTESKGGVRRTESKVGPFFNNASADSSNFGQELKEILTCLASWDSQFDVALEQVYETLKSDLHEYSSFFPRKITQRDRKSLVTRLQQTPPPTDPSKECKRRCGMVAVPNQGVNKVALYIEDFSKLAEMVNSGKLDTNLFTIEFASISNHELAFEQESKS